MFEIGKEYRRSTDIHGIYNGQSQGGISTPAKHPFVFLFTSSSGEQHGYKDEYRDDGIFWYTGEGQLGDMTMRGGNKAILEHKKNNKTLFLFESTRSAHVRFIGTAECLGYHEETRPDREQNDRKVFVFHLDINSVGSQQSSVVEPAPTYGDTSVKSLKNKGLKELREAALQSAPTESTNKEKRAVAYYRSAAITKYVVRRSKGSCEGCKDQAPFDTRTGPYLECHHVHRLADGGPDHPENVVALCPNCHRGAHYARDANMRNELLKQVALDAEEAARYG